MAEEITISDNGETEVQLTTLGTVYGSDAEGNPVEQHFTEEALQQIAEVQKGEEILVDSDHSSETGGSTAAAGWVSDLHVEPGKGLFGRIKWTNIGRKLIENRVFRWLSPSFWLNKETKEPVQMTSVALTNKPSQAGEIQPIINSAPMALGAEPVSQTKTETQEEVEMTKEEIVQLVKDTIAQMKSEEEQAKIEEKPVENACSDQTEEVKNEDIVENPEEKTEEVPEEKKEESPTEEKPDEEEKTEDEVITEQALNAAPVPKALQDAEWKYLRGDKFWQYLRDHPECR